MILPPSKRAGCSKSHTPTDFARQVFDSLPLAQASLSLFAYGIPDSILADLFQRIGIITTLEVVTGKEFAARIMAILECFFQGQCQPA